MAEYHDAIPPQFVSVDARFLHDMDERYAGEVARGTAFAVSSYPGDALTMQVLLEDGSLFSYLPLHALSHRQVREPRLELSDLVYRNCPGAHIAVSVHPYLEGALSCYFRKRDVWLGGSYVCTIDWPADNEQFHLCALENGQYAALPNHKVKFKNGPRSFADYRKLHATWKTENQ